MKQQVMDLMSLLADSRLKEKDGTHNTLMRVRLAEICTVPIWVTTANLPFGSLTLANILVVIEVNNDIEHIIWSVAPVSIIYFEGVIETGGTKEEKTENLESKPIGLRVSEEGIPAILENNLSWPSWVILTWCAE